jgi:hypothetical protein
MLLTLKGRGFRSLVVGSNSTTSATHDVFLVGTRILRIGRPDLMAFDSKPTDINFVPLNIDNLRKLCCLKLMNKGSSH